MRPFSTDASPAEGGAKAPSADPGPSGGLGLGPLPSLAKVLGGGLRPEGEALLAELTTELDAIRIAWIPERGEVVCGGRFDPGDVEWGQVRCLLPGSTAWLDPRRCPRAASRGTWQVLASPARRVRPQGVLWIEAPGPLALDADQLCALAGLVAAALAACAPDQPADPLLELGRRAAGLTHDLRNELTHALMQLERVRHEPSPEQVERLASALHQAKDLCVASIPGRPGSGDEPRPEAVRISDLLERASRTARDARRGGAGSVEVTCPNDLVVLAEEGPLARALANLTVNALEASPDGSPVRLTARAEGLRIVLEVEDDGPGLSHEAVRSLFAPGASGGGGTGWGTASVLEALDRLDGVLELETAPGRGTIARVLLAAPPHPGARIVLDPSRRRRSRRLLQLASSGPVAEARSPRRARTLLRDGQATELWIARGTVGDALAGLIADARRRGVRLRVLPAGHALPIH